ncbi:MAG TPA: ATPase domain-containing protein [Methanomassiliicoccales archaeon]|nr:ATPase domain-containing protein [Methanomassiliicoccales archaeon]
MSSDVRLKTYIEGFDRMLEGGIPANQIVLVAGTPGTMKSSISYYMMYHNVLENGMTAVYVTLEQSRESLLRQMEKMGMKTELVKDRLHVLDLSIIRKKLREISTGGSWMQVFKSYLSNLKEHLKFDIMVIDSLDVLETMADIVDRRTDLFYLFEWMRELGATVLLISEASGERLLDGKFDEGYLSDGIITLKMAVVRDVDTQRRIRCVKMRETNHDPSYYSLLFSNARFQVTKVISE